ncbi:hypothetical protein E4U54_005462 [Claviceps lovelessii]|nr:hypothetical protein E4U54_005462 [Claviceps lovelessii]
MSVSLSGLTGQQASLGLVGYPPSAPDERNDDESFNAGRSPVSNSLLQLNAEYTGDSSLTLLPMARRKGLVSFVEQKKMVLFGLELAGSQDSEGRLCQRLFLYPSRLPKRD